MGPCPVRRKIPCDLRLWRNTEEAAGKIVAIAINFSGAIDGVLRAFTPEDRHMQFEMQVRKGCSSDDRSNPDQVLGGEGECHIVIVRQWEIGGGECADRAVLAVIGTAGKQICLKGDGWFRFQAFCCPAE